MKKVDNKKMAIIIGAVVVLAILIVGGFLLLKGNKNGNKASKEKTDMAASKSIAYFTNLTYGAGTSYNGVELLFKQDKITYDNLATSNILTVAFSYAIDNLDTSIDGVLLSRLEGSYNVDDFTMIPGKAIRTAIKELFGIEFEDKGAPAVANFKYGYIYDNYCDVYLQAANKDIKTYTDHVVNYKAIETLEYGDKLVTEIAVAYIKTVDGKNYFAKDSTQQNVIYNSKDFKIKDDKIDEFDHYKITLKKNGDNYVFESIEKVKDKK